MPNDSSTEMDLVGIGAALKRWRFKVPPHQRSFQWTTYQVEELLKDVDEARADNAEDYFLGTAVAILPGSNGYHDILDGQQRFATASLIMKSIADELSSLGEQKRADGICREYLLRYDVARDEELPQLRLNTEDDTYFRQLLSSEAVAPGKSDPRSHHLMFAAHEYIRDWIGKASSNQPDPVRWLVELLKYLDEAVRLVIVRVSDDANAYRIFETLNDRGLSM